MNGMIFLRGHCITNACKLMEWYKFPTKIRSDFNKKGIVYMSLPNGSLTTDLPESVIKQIDRMRPKRLVYHIVANYASPCCSCVCLIYYLLIAENNMEVFSDNAWLPAYLINVTIPGWSGDENVQIKRYRKGVKCIEKKYLDL